MNQPFEPQHCKRSTSSRQRQSRNTSTSVYASNSNRNCFPTPSRNDDFSCQPEDVTPNRASSDRQRFRDNNSAHSSVRSPQLYDGYGGGTRDRIHTNAFFAPNHPRHIPPDQSQHRRLSNFQPSHMAQNGHRFSNAPNPRESMHPSQRPTYSTRNPASSSSYLPRKVDVVADAFPSRSQEHKVHYSAIANPMERKREPEQPVPETPLQPKRVPQAPDERDMNLFGGPPKGGPTKRGAGRNTASAVVDLDGNADDQKAVSPPGRPAAKVEQRSRTNTTAKPSVPPLKSAPKSRSSSRESNVAKPLTRAPQRHKIRSAPVGSPPKAKRKRKVSENDAPVNVDTRAVSTPTKESKTNVAPAMSSNWTIKIDMNALADKFKTDVEKHPGIVDLPLQGLTSADLHELLKDLQPSERVERRLNLQLNQLTRLDEVLCRRLLDFEPSSINLSCNQIQSLPKNVSSFQHLRILDLSRNKLKEIPEQICQLDNLEVLALSYNEIEKLPAGFYALKKLTILNMRGNRLVRLPEDFSSEGCELDTLDVSENREFECLPQCAIHWTKLEDLQIEETRFEGYLQKQDRAVTAIQLAKSYAGKTVEALMERQGGKSSKATKDTAPNVVSL